MARQPKTAREAWVTAPPALDWTDIFGPVVEAPERALVCLFFKPVSSQRIILAETIDITR